MRIEDALAATKAAVEEGIVAGGGRALISTISEVKNLISTLKGDEKTGAEIILKSLETPVRQIAENSGVDGGVVIHNLLKENNPDIGYDALNDKYVNMFEAGIVDPTKVTRSALQNASSVASTLLTTECLVVDDDDKEKTKQVEYWL